MSPYGPCTFPYYCMFFSCGPAWIVSHAGINIHHSHSLPHLSSTSRLWHLSLESFLAAVLSSLLHGPILNRSLPHKIQMPWLCNFFCNHMSKNRNLFFILWRPLCYVYWCIIFPVYFLWRDGVFVKSSFLQRGFMTPALWNDPESFSRYLPCRGGYPTSCGHHIELMSGIWPGNSMARIPNPE